MTLLLSTLYTASTAQAGVSVPAGSTLMLVFPYGIDGAVNTGYQVNSVTANGTNMILPNDALGNPNRTLVVTVDDHFNSGWYLFAPAFTPGGTVDIVINWSTVPDRAKGFYLAFYDDYTEFVTAGGDGVSVSTGPSDTFSHADGDFLIATGLRRNSSGTMTWLYGETVQLNQTDNNGAVTLRFNLADKALTGTSSTTGFSMSSSTPGLLTYLVFRASATDPLIPFGVATASLSMQGIGISIDAPTIPFGTATAGLAMQSIGITAANPSIPVGTASASLTMQGIGIAIDAPSIPVGAATASLTMQGIGISTANPTIPVGTATASVSMQGIGIGIADPVIPVGTASASLSMQPIGITATGATIPFGTAASSLAMQGIAITITPPTIPVGTATASLSMQGIGITQAGQISIPFGTATASLSMQGVGITITPPTIAFGTATASLAMQGIGISPANQIIPFGTATSSLSMQGVGIAIAQPSIAFGTATASLSMQSIAITPELQAALEALALVLSVSPITSVHRVFLPRLSLSTAEGRNTLSSGHDILTLRITVDGVWID